jgi:hypothetical protein
MGTELVSGVLVVAEKRFHVWVQVICGAMSTGHCFRSWMVYYLTQSGTIGTVNTIRR